VRPLRENAELTDEHPESRLERATESTFAKVLARFAVPVLLAIVGWFVVRGIDRVEAKQDAQGVDIVAIKSDIRDVNTRLDAQVLRQVEHNTQAIQKHEERLQVLERTVQVQ
jgi:DNA polymerase elongation subunit (family B)